MKNYTKLKSRLKIKFKLVEPKTEEFFLRVMDKLGNRQEMLRLLKSLREQ